jgi:hypothetical protein
MVLRTLLVSKGHKKGDGEKNNSHNNPRRERRRKRFEVSEDFFGVWNQLCEISIYRENSQLICEKLYEQIIHILDLVQKFLKLSNKIYHIEYKIIFQIKYKNILDCIPKYFTCTIIFQIAFHNILAKLGD